MVLDTFDWEKIDYILQHNGSCGGGVCSICPITKVRGKVVGCNNDVSIRVAKYISDKEGKYRSK